MKIISKSILTALLWVITSISFAQNAPYSRIGIGELIPQSSIVNQGMGGAGTGAVFLNMLNMSNPAMLPYNRYTVFEAGGFGSYKRLENAKANQNSFGGGLGYLAFAFPIAKKMTISAGLQPYSTVSYSSVTYEKIPNTPTYIRYSYDGYGGMTQTYIGGGLKVFKDISVGWKSSYNFGASRNQSRSQLEDNRNSFGEYIVELLDRVNYSGFTHELGLGARFKLNKKLTPTYLVLGATHSLEANINATTIRAMQKLTAAETVVYSDTINFNEKDKIIIPSRTTFGISIQKPIHYLITFEASMQDWSNTSPTDSLTKSVRWALGAEWIPNATAVGTYFERMAYRAGFSHTMTPYLINGKHLRDIQLSIGTSLPVGRSFSALNIALILGQRGTTEAGLIQERYFRFSLGASINDRWFVRRKYD